MIYGKILPKWKVFVLMGWDYKKCPNCGKPFTRARNWSVHLEMCPVHKEIVRIYGEDKEYDVIYNLWWNARKRNFVDEDELIKYLEEERKRQK